MPIGQYLPDRAGQDSEPQLRLFGDGRLQALFDAGHPDEQPCHAAALSAAQRATSEGAPIVADCPSGAWTLHAWPVVVNPGGGAIGALLALRPVGDVSAAYIALAQHYGLDPEPVLEGARLPNDDAEAASRIDAVHAEVSEIARDLGSRLSLAVQLSSARGQAPPPALPQTDTPEEHAIGLQQLIDAMVLEAVVIIDFNGTIRYANQASATWFGSGLIEGPCHHFCGSTRPPCAMCPRRSGSTTELFAGTVRHHQLNLSGRALDVSVYPIRLTGDTPGYLLVARDITPRRRLEQSLQRQTAELALHQQQLQLILDCMGEGLLVTDREGVIMLSNPIARMLFDATPSDLHGRRLLELLPGHPSLSEGFERLLDGRDERIVEELRIPGPSISDLLLTVAAMPTDDGTPGGFVATMKDITRLKELDRLKDQFISNVSHELRTPMATVRGFARTMLQQPDMASEHRNEFLGLIDREAGRLGRLIEDLLSMARMDDEHRPLYTERVNLGELVREVTVFFSQACSERGIAFELLTPDGPSAVDADPSLVAQLMHNLIGNAVKFAPDDGHVHVSVEPDGDHTTFRVKDDGPGIPEAEQSRVFERFYRARSAERAVPGTGLGLAIVKRIVDAHGWQIGLQSTPGAGTELWVTMRSCIAPPTSTA